MNFIETFFSPTTPLMRIVLTYLSVDNIEKWRHTCKHAQHIVYISCHPKTWNEYVMKSGLVYECQQCSKIRGMNGLILSQCCKKYICKEHILSCCVCNTECCVNCALEHGCMSC